MQNRVYEFKGKALKSFLSFKGVSQAYFAQKSNINTTALSCFINGRNKPGASSVNRMIKALSKMECPETTMISIFPTLGIVKETRTSKKKPELNENTLDDIALDEDDLGEFL